MYLVINRMWGQGRNVENFVGLQVSYLSILVNDVTEIGDIKRRRNLKTKLMLHFGPIGPPKWRLVCKIWELELKIQKPA